jgi:ring-1,2-phenylacetyl-CoA epoxidase subunit PaaE
MAAFHSLTVLDIRRETEDAVSILLNVPPALADAYRFAPGQYLTLRTQIDGEDIRRSYSICSGVNDNELRVAVKRVPKGKFSHFANHHLSVGDTLDVMPPDGRFTGPIEPDKAKHYLMIAAGSGITPVLSLAKTYLQAEPQSQVTLIYGNKSAASILFLEELQGLKDTFPTRFSLIHILSRQPREVPMLNGRIDRDKCQALFTGPTAPVDPTQADAVFLCGPQGMVEDVTAALTDAGVTSDKIHTELFTPADGGAAIAKARAQRAESLSDEDRAKLRHVTVIYDGIEIELDLASDGVPILDAAMDRSADIPYSCKGGMCCTCRCKVLKGDVAMDVNYALTKEETDAGFVLACQSHPMTDEVVLDFDAK